MAEYKSIEDIVKRQANEYIQKILIEINRLRLTDFKSTEKPKPPILLCQKMCSMFYKQVRKEHCM